MDQRAAMATMVVVGRAMIVLVLLALCALHPASAADIVWGSSSTFTQKAAGGDRYLAMCESMRLGSELAFNATNARSDRMGVLASRNLVTLFLDDNRNNTATALNTNALLARSDDDLLGLLVTSDGEGAATAFLSMTGQAIDSVPFVGPWSGLGLLQSPFKRWVFNTLPTSFQSLTYAIAKFLANDRLLSRFALLYPHPSLISGVDIRAGVEAKLALLGYRLASHYGVPSFSADPQTIGAAVANISAGEPQAVIMVVSSGQTSAFIKAAKAAMTRDDVIYILDGSVSNNITDDLTTERERENVYLVFPVPLLSDTDLPIVRDFWADRDAHAPDWRQVVQPASLEGYIEASFAEQVLDLLPASSNQTGKAFVDAIYSRELFAFQGLRFGPFGNTVCTRNTYVVPIVFTHFCGSTHAHAHTHTHTHTHGGTRAHINCVAGRLACKCNQGLHQTWMIKLNSSLGWDNLADTLVWTDCASTSTCASISHPRDTHERTRTHARHTHSEL